MEELVTQLVNGLQLGAVYGLIALGYSLVFGVMKLINFAHGDVMMVGSYAGLLAARYLGTGFPGSILAAMIAAGLLGILLERCAYYPLRNAPPLAAMVSALGASLILQYGCMLIFSADPMGYPARFHLPTFRLGPFLFSGQKLVAALAAVLICGGLSLFLKCTPAGRAMRAVASDPLGAALCGIREDRVRRMAFFLGSALAGAAGVLYGAMYTVTPLMGASAGLKAFCGAVVGGIGSVPGAMGGGLLLGVAESLAGAYIGAVWKDCMAFLLMTAVLLLRKNRERV